jgi:hypothetical protein
MATFYFFLFQSKCTKAELPVLLGLLSTAFFVALRNMLYTRVSVQINGTKIQHLLFVKLNHAEKAE